MNVVAADAGSRVAVGFRAQVGIISNNDMVDLVSRWSALKIEHKGRIAAPLDRGAARMGAVVLANAQHGDMISNNDMAADGTILGLERCVGIVAPVDGEIETEIAVVGIINREIEFHRSYSIQMEFMGDRWK